MQNAACPSQPSPRTATWEGCQPKGGTRHAGMHICRIHAGNLRSSRALNGLGHHRSLRPIFTGIALYSVGIALYGYAFSDILDGEYDERRFVLLSSTGGTLFMLSYLSTLKQHVVIGSAERRTASHFRADQRVVVVPVLSPHHTGLAFALAW